MMKKWIICCCFLGITWLQAEEAAQEYQFLGKHFIASYSGCDPEAIVHVEGLMQAMQEGVKQSGAQVLNTMAHIFPGNGLTMALLLSESHATIHTYPEHNACFVDLFTCGDHCDYAPFDQVLKEYLRPQASSSKVLIRDEAIVVGQ